MYKPFFIGKSFRVVPPGTESIENITDLIMVRGAFGSGEHETTANCIDIMQTLNFAGNSFLDLGSGTGILAIAAMKLGAENGLCVDIEPDAVESARRNCMLNNFGAEIEHRCGTLDDVSEDQFDLVLANIYGDILLDICSNLVAKIKSGGTLLLSGILWEYNFDIRKKYESAGCTMVQNKLMEEFSTVLLTKN